MHLPLDILLYSGLVKMKDQPNNQYIPFLDLHPSYSCIPLLRLENLSVNKPLDILLYSGLVKMKDQPNNQYIRFLDLHPSYSCIPS